jgi:hypothetical protein
MNLHYKIFRDCLPRWEYVRSHILFNSSGEASLEEELLFSIVCILDEKLSSIVHKLYEQDEFCIFCMYANLNASRKTIARYLWLEKSIDEEYRIQLEEIQKTMNNLCIKINETYKRGEGCNIVLNETKEFITLLDKQAFDYICDLHNNEGEME